VIVTSPPPSTVVVVVVALSSADALERVLLSPLMLEVVPSPMLVLLTTPVALKPFVVVVVPSECALTAKLLWPGAVVATVTSPFGAVIVTVLPPALSPIVVPSGRAAIIETPSSLCVDSTVDDNDALAEPETRPSSLRLLVTTARVRESLSPLAVDLAVVLEAAAAAAEAEAEVEAELDGGPSSVDEIERLEPVWTGSTLDRQVQ
jgi:hypothetical protein